MNGRQRVVKDSVEAPRELWIGRSSLKAILGTILLPGTGDRALAGEVYSGQTTAEPEPSGRPDNLFRSHPTGSRYARRPQRSRRASCVRFNPMRLRAMAGV
jgi:hypothetical protein